jgi:hypothetical protein
MNMFEILNGKAIVAGDEDYGLVVTWNGSATFEIFDVIDGLFRAIDVHTRYDVNSVAEARKIGDEFIEDMIVAISEEMDA